jgi:hypothetical protein
MQSMASLKELLRELLHKIEAIFDAVAPQNSDEAPYDIIIAQNDSIIVRIGTSYWACPLSSKECSFLQTLVQRGGKMDGNDAKQWVHSLDDQDIRNFIRSITRKLDNKKMPVRLHFVGWVISIKIPLI